MLPECLPKEAPHPEQSDTEELPSSAAMKANQPIKIIERGNRLENGKDRRTPTPCAEHKEVRGKNAAGCAVKSAGPPTVNPQTLRNTRRSQMRSEAATKCLEEAQ